MQNGPLTGKKVALVIESQYIPSEIEGYRSGFAAYGAQVDLVSRLWGQPKATFFSTLDPAVQRAAEFVDVSLDFGQVTLADYAAVVVAANYVSVRLRWSEREDVTAENAAEVVRSVPAVQFLRRAMENRRIIKALPCHALWLLTPCPELIRGRKVLCNKVVLSDVLNAGGIYTTRPGAPLDEQVVVDGDLVTTSSANATPELVDCVRDLIMERRNDD
jgi:putative intracellular protease/amidase